MSATTRLWAIVEREYPLPLLLLLAQIYTFADAMKGTERCLFLFIVCFALLVVVSYNVSNILFHKDEAKIGKLFQLCVIIKFS